jgi:anthranilate phosphoribosyltransferase
LKKKQTIKLSISDAIDICGTGGSWLDRINTSTLTAILLAKKYWKKIAKHWNKASSGRFGSFDLL